MRRLFVLVCSALFLTLFVHDAAEAQRFGGGGFRGGGFRAAGFGGARWAGGGFARPGWGVAGARWGAVGRAGWVGRPGWGVGRPVWGGARWAGVRPGWGPGWGYRRAYRWPVYAAGVGLASAAYYGSSYYSPYGHYGYGYGEDGCVPIRQTVWDGYGYRVVWVNPCNY